jgi:hypothetical protein
MTFQNEAMREFIRLELQTERASLSMTEAEKSAEEALKNTVSAQKERIKATLTELIAQRELIKSEKKADWAVKYVAHSEAIQDVTKSLEGLNKTGTDKTRIDTLNEEIAALEGLGFAYGSLSSAMLGHMSVFVDVANKQREMQKLVMEGDEFTEEGLAKKIEVMEASKEAYSQFFSAIGSMALDHMMQQSEAKMAQIKAEAKLELGALRESLEYKRASDKQKKKMEDDLRKDKNKLMQKEFETQKNIKRAEVVMNTATAIMGVWKDVPKYDWGISAGALAAMVATIGTVQLAMINQQKAPQAFAQGGLVGGMPHSQGGTIIEAEKGEFVMSRNAVESIGAERLSQLNEGGGGSPITVNITGNVLSKDFIEDEAIPMIKEAVRRGADIGVA